MIRRVTTLQERLTQVSELIEIPTSHYRLAVKRYESLYDWFVRQESTIRCFSPSVYPQGSFRYGTVIRPLSKKEEYDLDLVLQLLMPKDKISQAYLKDLVGNEVIGYARANGFKSPAEEKKRCWRLNYADDVSFHMDILPAIPDDPEFIQLLIQAGVRAEFAEHAISITDNGVPKYRLVSPDWPKSNPKGFAKWFEKRMKEVATQRMKSLVANRVYASIDEVPAFEWKTALQRCIQILKRHRDVMFHAAPEFKPISMIITTLASHAYSGESNIAEAMVNILDGMSNFVRDEFPRIGNPVNPAEDFADKWKSDRRFEDNFWMWLTQVKSDVASIGSLLPQRAADLTNKRFEVEYRTPDVANTNLAATIPAVHIATPKVHITSPSRPWGV